MSRVREAPALPTPSPCPVEKITAKGHQTELVTECEETRFCTELTRVQRPLLRFKVWAAVNKKHIFSMTLPPAEPRRYVIAESADSAEEFYLTQLKIDREYFSARSKLLED